MKTAKHLLGFLTLAFLVFAGCHELGHDGLGEGYGDPANTLRGRAMKNDNRYSTFLIQTDDGQQLNFAYDAQTRVRYRDRDYPLQSIQQGDYLVVRTRRTNRPPPPIADLITVTSTGDAGRVDSFQGRVERIDGRRGTFEVRGPNNRIIVVTMPSNPTRAESDRFNRLRNGDNVRIEGRFVSGDRFELESFL